MVRNVGLNQGDDVGDDDVHWHHTILQTSVTCLPQKSEQDKDYPHIGHVSREPGGMRSTEIVSSYNNLILFYLSHSCCCYRMTLFCRAK